MPDLQPQEASVLLRSLAEQIRQEHKTTLRVLQVVPADKGDYRPDPRCMDALELAWHIASAETFFLAGAVNGEFPAFGERPGEVTNGPAVAAWYAENVPQWFDKMDQLPGDHLLKNLEFHGFKTTPLGCLQLMLVHSIHHRGQLSAYLRPMGTKVPSIYGGSADEPMAAEAAQA